MAIFHKKIIVGFHKRPETYTGKLGGISGLTSSGEFYHKGIDSWRKQTREPIEPEIFDNIPTEGFVLNKKAGGQKWSHNVRQIKARVYDPRGFDFEISMYNLLYILEYCNSTKGKALDGEFVYIWVSGNNGVFLCPVNSGLYEEYVNKPLNSSKIKAEKKKIPKKELKVDSYYKDIDGVIGKYLGVDNFWVQSTYNKSKGPLTKSYYYQSELWNIDNCYKVTFRPIEEVFDYNPPKEAKYYDYGTFKEIVFEPIDTFNVKDYNQDVSDIVCKKTANSDTFYTTTVHRTGSGYWGDKSSYTYYLGCSNYEIQFDSKNRFKGTKFTRGYNLDDKNIQLYRLIEK